MKSRSPQLVSSLLKPERFLGLAIVMGLYGALLFFIWLMMKIVAFIGLGIEYHGERLEAKAAAGSATGGEGTELLFLRSFRDDTRRFHIFNESISFSFDGAGLAARSFEQILLGELSYIGRSLAIGPPGEKLPPLGAPRRLIEDEGWKDEVERLAGSARLVVLVAGRTAGLSWEIARLFELGFAGKLLVVFPKGSSRDRSKRWRAFLSGVPSDVKVALPATLPQGAACGIIRRGEFIFFRSRGIWIPRLRDYGHILAELRPYLEDPGLWPDQRRHEI